MGLITWLSCYSTRAKDLSKILFYFKHNLTHYCVRFRDGGVLRRPAVAGLLAMTVQWIMFVVIATSSYFVERS